MGYNILNRIDGRAVQRQLPTVEDDTETLLKLDIEPVNGRNEERNITLRVDEDNSSWDSEYIGIVRSLSDPYVAVWVSGSLEAFLHDILEDIVDDLDSRCTLRLIESATEIPADVDGAEVTPN